METSLADADYSDECCTFGWTAGDNMMFPDYDLDVICDESWNTDLCFFLRTH